MGSSDSFKSGPRERWWCVYRLQEILDLPLQGSVGEASERQGEGPSGDPAGLTTPASFSCFTCFSPQQTWNVVLVQPPQFQNRDRGGDFLPSLCVLSTKGPMQIDQKH